MKDHKAVSRSDDFHMINYIIHATWSYHLFIAQDHGLDD